MKQGKKVVACIIARTNSTRLPRKVVKEIFGKTIIEYIIEKTKHVSGIDSIYICTSKEPDDQILEKIAQRNNINFYAGSPTSVIDRMLDVVKIENADHLVRITGDNIFTDEIFLEEMIRLHLKNDADYTRTEKVPLGLTAEVIKVPALKKCYKEIDPNKTEYLMFYIFDPGKYKCQVLLCEKTLWGTQYTLTVDIPEDYERSVQIIKNLYKNGRVFYDDIVRYHKDKGLPYFEMKSTGLVKYPNGSKVSYADFRASMDEKIGASHVIQLKDGFYESKRPF